MKVVILEKQEVIRGDYQRLLAKHFPNIKIVGKAETATRAIEVLKNTKPDIVIMDATLQEGNSFQVLHSCTPYTFKTIFITNTKQHAIKAIKCNATDYLLKPINELEFCNAINKAIRTQKRVKPNRSNRKYPHDNKRLTLKTNNDVHIIPIEDILYCKSNNSYTTFYIANRKEIIISRSIKEFHEKLEQYNFIRPHQSYLVNTWHIDRVDKSKGGGILLHNGINIPISKRMRTQTIKIIDNI